MLTLINTNRMTPAIGPIGLDYVAGAVKAAGIEVEVIDLCLAENPGESLKQYFSRSDCQLVGLTFRNIDDSFWPSGEWFVPKLADTIKTIRDMTDAPIALGGVGFSILARGILEYTGADFGIRGDGEDSTVSLLKELSGKRKFEKVPGLVWHEDGQIKSNQPAWPEKISLATSRDVIDNKAYFARGGQCGIETKRGCDGKCIYCVDPLAKGHEIRVRNPVEIADEVESLLSQGIDVLHLCDSEFNIPREHAYSVCREFNIRSLGKRMRWYAYMSVMPFDDELAREMKKAGCVGINFGGDSANEFMLKKYCRGYCKEDIALAISVCKTNGIATMIDLLLGGPGETRESIAETIDFAKGINLDCVGAALGVRVYQGTVLEKIVQKETSLQNNPNVRRKYSGPVDFFKPTFYIASDLGAKPAELVCDLIGEDKRFFPPSPEISEQDVEVTSASGHNYNYNEPLIEAIRNGARGAYWDILRKLKN